MTDQNYLLGVALLLLAIPALASFMGMLYPHPNLHRNINYGAIAFIILGGFVLYLVQSPVIDRVATAFSDGSSYSSSVKPARYKTKPHRVVPVARPRATSYRESANNGSWRHVN